MIFILFIQFDTNEKIFDEQRLSLGTKFTLLGFKMDNCLQDYEKQNKCLWNSGSTIAKGNKNWINNLQGRKNILYES